jgi:hypothetical protein
VGADQRLAAGNQLVMLGSREQRAALVEMIAGATR